jgi:tetratricopeptide (TPR) repeat protein
MLRKSMALAAMTVPLALGQAQPALAETPSERLGEVHFSVSCNDAQKDFDRAVTLLHSFWFGPADKAFRDIAARDPQCGMAWWGAAMVAMGNPLAGAPSPDALKTGWEAVEKAKAAGAETDRERAYIAAIETFYRDADKVPHKERALAYEKAMEQLAATYPDDSEAKVFYALSLNITFDPSDKSYKNQLKAAGILEPIFEKQPQHPGVAHYIIHSYDFPPIAAKGLKAAHLYAKIAPDSPHALHMPSHIFTRVGAWQESIESNRASGEMAMKEYAAKPSGGPLSNAYHAYDYLTYAHLQMGEDAAAKALTEKIVEIETVHGTGAPIAAPHAVAAIPVRYALEREQWAEAAKLELPAVDVGWEKWPQAVAIVAFGKGLGAARSNDLATAKAAVAELDRLRNALKEKKQGYWENQVAIQQQVVEAWAQYAAGNTEEAVATMRTAADAEEKTEKHPVTPGPIIPARELLGDMLAAQGKHQEALAAYEHSMKVEPNRFRGYAGAARAAELAGEKAKAEQYYNRLLELAAKADGDRPVLKQARAFLGQQ